MDDAPKEIYLQYHGKEYGVYDGITWCEDKINDDDVMYVRLDLVAAYYSGYTHGAG